MKLFLILIVSHFVGDYMGYSQTLSEMKRSRNIFFQFFAVGIHATIHMAIVMCAMDMIFRYDPELTVSVGKLVFIFHFSIDFIRSVIESRFLDFGNYHIGWKYGVKSIWERRWTKHVVSGLTDQVLHLVSLIIIVGVMV